MSDVAVFLIYLLLAKKAENLSAKSKKEAIELGSNMENESLAKCIRVSGKTLHIYKNQLSHCTPLSKDT